MTVPTTEPDALRAAASVVLVRDGAAGLEVLLLRRHQASGVLGGVYVFPGGKLDAADAQAHPGWLDATPDALCQRLGEPAAQTAAPLAQGLFVAALRETFEEAGVLLAEPLPVTTEAGTPGVASATEALPRLRADLHAGHPWPTALGRLGWRWRTAALQPWSRWITPTNPPVGTPRFDTRFFLARMPAGQEVEHDNHEATEALWLTPRDALARSWAGEIGLIPPQLMGLAQLARHADVASAWAEAEAAAALRPPPCVLPTTFMADGHKAMCYPGDPLHPVAERALPGPTRLRLVGRRFEPFDGFEGWFQ